MDDAEGREWFLHHLSHALRNLYDPFELRVNPLVSLLGADRRREPMFALQEILLNAIEALVPQGGVPPTARTWRVFQILHRRYGQQRTQKEVSLDVGLGIRQLQREERLAREVLADHLLAKYELASKLDSLPPAPERSRQELDKLAGPTLSRTDELQQLDRAVPIQPTDVAATVREVLKISQPLLQTYRVAIQLSVSEDFPLLSSKPLLLRQALLGVIGAVARMASEGEVAVVVGQIGSLVSIRILSNRCDRTITAQTQVDADLEMAGQLVCLCGGSLQRIAGHELPGSSEEMELTSWGVEITLTAEKPVRILVIDDNDDVRLMFERYLADTRFHFIGASNSVEGLALAQALIPDVIVLDVMMPEQDGWTILGQLRVHPVTSDIPVLICTILAQEDLALALGAAQFIRKPVSQPELMQALERQLALEHRGSG